MQIAFRLQNDGSNDLAAPDKEAMRISLSTGHFGWKHWNTQRTVDITSTQYQMDK